MRPANRALSVAALVSATLAGCAQPPRNANTFGSGSRMAPETVVYGTVRAVRPIRIRRGTADAMMGGTAGAVGGGGIGAAFGGMKGAIVGALAGGVLGTAIGIRATVPGELVTVGFLNAVQAFPQPMAKGEKPFFVGEHVEVLEGRRFDRVIPQ
ncbi:MAG: hypothetical protein M0Z85_12820 [Gammaproteobacteria bacterium]|nr:hypothetical protein [Gammaproteobacteria bacterium]